MVDRDEMRERLGNIDQIRDLLFGHKIREYEQRFQECEQSLENITRELSLFETETRDRLDQLQESLTTELHSALDSLEKKLKYFSMTTNDQTHQLQKELQSTAQKSSQSIDSLHKTFMGQTNFLKNDLMQTRDKLEQEMQSFREQIGEMIQQELISLRDNKVSRVDLADILFELCVKIKDNEFVSNFPETPENNSTPGFFLPEQQTTLESEPVTE
jgi:hypothetical protein